MTQVNLPRGAGKWLLRAAVSVVCLGLMTACASAPSKPSNIKPGDYRYTQDYLDWMIRKAMKKQDLVGLSIAVLDDQSIVWQQGYGFADKANAVAATEYTQYRAGSISKVFTSVAAMQLVDQGQLDIDAPVTDVVPEFTIHRRFDNATPITPRHLMTHHAGLPADWLDGMFTAEPASFSEVVPLLRETYATLPPDTYFSYSNLGFSLLGEVIQRASGEPFTQYMDQHVLEPLNMGTAAFAAGPAQGDGAALAYDADGKQVIEEGLRDVPAGGLNASAPQLLQLARMWFANGQAGNQRVLSRAAIHDMQRTQNSAVPLDMDRQIGLAWHREDNAVPGGGVLITHSGGTISHCSVLMLLPERRLAVAVLSNSAHAMGTVDAVAKQALTLMLEAKTGQAAVSEPSMATADARFPPVDTSALAGTYATDLGLATLTPKGDRLRVTLNDHTLSMERADDGYYRLRYRLMGLFPIKLGELSALAFTGTHIDGHNLLVAASDGHFGVAGKRVEPVNISPTWRARLGEYRYVGDDNALLTMMGLQEMHLIERDGFLLVKMVAEETGYLPIAPLDDDTAIIEGLGRGRGETIRVEVNNGKERLHHSGLVFERVE